MFVFCDCNKNITLLSAVVYIIVFTSLVRYIHHLSLSYRWSAVVDYHTQSTRNTTTTQRRKTFFLCIQNEFNAICSSKNRFTKLEWRDYFCFKECAEYFYFLVVDCKLNKWDEKYYLINAIWQLCSTTIQTWIVVKFA